MLECHLLISLSGSPANWFGWLRRHDPVLVDGHHLPAIVTARSAQSKDIREAPRRHDDCVGVGLRLDGVALCNAFCEECAQRVRPQVGLTLRQHEGFRGDLRVLSGRAGSTGRHLLAGAGRGRTGRASGARVGPPSLAGAGFGPPCRLGLRAKPGSVLLCCGLDRADTTVLDRPPRRSLCSLHRLPELTAREDRDRARAEMEGQLLRSQDEGTYELVRAHDEAG